MPRQPDPAAVAAARKVISSLAIREPREIDIELIAVHHGLFVKRRPLVHEEGYLVRAGNRGVVCVSEDAYRSAKWRFVIAHELGHFLRHPQVDQFDLCTAADLTRYVGSGREAEANDFAAELLMPQTFFEKACDRNRPSLRDVGEIAEWFGTSLTATALRFVRFSPEPCAIVYSVNGAVEWLDWSEDFGLAIRKGHKLGSRTYAGDLFSGQSIDDRPQQVDGDAWSDSSRAEDIDLFEHSRRIGPDAVLTMLWHEAP